jgi:hypothetical protein
LFEETIRSNIISFGDADVPMGPKSMKIVVGDGVFFLCVFFFFFLFSFFELDDCYVGL